MGKLLGSWKEQLMRMIENEAVGRKDGGKIV
jgi:hypothetical protein